MNDALPAKPSCPPLTEEALERYDLPPPYSPYDPSKQLPQHVGNENIPIGFQAVAPGTLLPPYGQFSQQPIVPQVNVSNYTTPQNFAPPPEIHVVTAIALGPDSARMRCPFCQADVNTNVTKTPSTTAFISSFLLCVIGCVYGCCLIPFFLDSCKTSKHHCPSCNKFVGKYNPCF